MVDREVNSCPTKHKDLFPCFLTKPLLTLETRWPKEGGSRRERTCNTMVRTPRIIPPVPPQRDHKVQVGLEVRYVCYKYNRWLRSTPFGFTDPLSSLPAAPEVWLAQISPTGSLTLRRGGIQTRGPLASVQRQTVKCGRAISLLAPSLQGCFGLDTSPIPGPLMFYKPSA